MQAESDSPTANPNSPFYRRLGLTLLVGLAFAVGALIFARLAAWVLEGETQYFDDAVRAMIHQSASPALTAVMRIVTMLGSTLFLVPLSVGVVVIFLRAGRRRAAALFAITMAGAVLLMVALKLSFHRLRPLPFFDIAPPGSYSFPSGHALASFCFYGALAAIIADRTSSRAGRVMIWTLGILLIVLIGFSRIYLGVHYPSDVAAGYAAALVWVMTVAFVDRLLQRAPLHDQPPKKENKRSGART